MSKVNSLFVFFVFSLSAFLSLFLAAYAAAAGTAETESAVEKTNTPAFNRNVKITWFGHSMFLLEFAETKVLIDPYSDIGYPLPIRPIYCDICIVSHKHLDHSNLNLAGGPYALLNEEGRSSVRGVNFNLIKSYHDRKKGADRGENLVSVFEFDNVRFAHAGDIGAFDEELIKKIGRIDVLMVPVGGCYTIDAYEAWELIRYLNPKIIIPMHYKTDRLEKKNPIDPIDKFISGRTNIVEISSGSCEINLLDMPKQETIYFFKF